MDAFLTLSLLFFFCLFSQSSSDESSTMQSLLKAFSNPPSSWTGTNHCSWPGVTCTASKVTSINLVKQSLSATLPSLSSLTSLQTLALQDNSFSGPFPDLNNLTSLNSLYLDRNLFTQVPKGFFQGLTGLTTVSISENPKLEKWGFPEEIKNAVLLQEFLASNASLMGKIPEFLGNLESLTRLVLSYNDLTGSLPSSFAGSHITHLWINNQGLSGDLSVLSNMSMLNQLWVHQNAFTGPIPDLSNCKDLFDLQLRGNQLTGVVPESVLKLPSLLNISLDNNKLQGPFPEFGPNVKVTLGTTNTFCKDKPGPCDPQVTALLSVAEDLGYPDKLAEAWPGNDACKPWNFVTCDGQKNVAIVNFANQGFFGIISPAFANLTSLLKLLLNDNNLTGTIPASLATLKQLQELNFANNNLSGAVPVFPAGVKVITKPGNLFIGTNVTTGGGGSSNTTGGGGTSSSGSKKSSVSIGLIIGVVIGAVFFVIGVGILCYKYYLKKRSTSFGRVEGSEVGSEMVKSSAVVSVVNGYNGTGPSDLRSQSSGDHRELPTFEGGNIVISFQVLRQVTNYFSEDNILGRGGFGTVYYGELQDRTKIAVKRMESGSMGTKGMNEFQSEIAVLTKVRHRHLVALLGSVVNGNERLLVYEYMPQGTLSQHLFECEKLGYPPLTWKQRVAIALDVARGVEYLHSLAQSSFIHRDLKPSNILLDDHMRAKVADFGLVKTAPDGKYSLETRLAGTFGYLAPEYAATGRVTTKVDVYAYGVVLMEIITGRKSLDESLSDESSHLVTWFRRVLIKKDNLHKAIDQTLDPDEETYESICKVAELAGHCTAREPFQRPDMGHAVNVLGPLVEQWKPSSHQEEDNYGIDLHMSLPQALQQWQADEGTSRTFDDRSYQTDASMTSKPAGFADSFKSSDCR